jgi:hypothetical protein
MMIAGVAEEDEVEEDEVEEDEVEEDEVEEDEVEEAHEDEEDGVVELRREIPQETPPIWTPTPMPIQSTLSLLLRVVESPPLTKLCILLTVPPSHRAVPLFPQTSMACTPA